MQSLPLSTLMYCSHQSYEAIHFRSDLQIGRMTVASSVMCCWQSARPVMIMIDKYISSHIVDHSLEIDFTHGI